MLFSAQDNHAYVVQPEVMDNPLPIQPAKTLPFRAHIMYNGSVPKPRCDLASIHAVQSLGCYNDTAHQCGYKMVESSRTANDWDFAARGCAAAGMSYAGAEDGLGAEVRVVVLISALPVPSGDPSVRNRSGVATGHHPVPRSRTRNAALPVQATKASTAGAAGC